MPEKVEKDNYKSCDNMSMRVADSRTYLNEDRSGGSGGSDGGCWGRRSGTEKIMIISIAILSILTLSLSIALGVSDARKLTTKDTYKVCNEKECIQAASRLRSAMNTAASPCDNFYEYACGGWMQDTEIPADKSRWGMFDDLRDQLSEHCVSLLEQEKSDDPKTAIEMTRAFYQLCAATEKVSKDEGKSILITALNNFGGMPLIENSTYRDTLDWVARMIDARGTLGIDLLMVIQVAIDIKNPLGYIIYLDQASSFGLGRLYLKDMDKNKAYVDAYKAYIRKTLCLLNEDNACPEDYKKEEIQKIVNFESEVAKLTKDPVLRRDPNSWYFKMPISDLQNNVTLSPTTSWLEYINAILGPTNQTVGNSTEIVVEEQEYLGKMIELVEKTPDKSEFNQWHVKRKPSIPPSQQLLANYIGWRLLQAIGPYSSREFRENELEFKKVTTGIKKQPTIEDKCFSITNDFFGYALGKLYVDKHFSKDAKTDMEQMEKNVAEAFRNLLKENNWMDENTKEKARTKLTEMVGMIGYPEWIEDSDKLDKYYHYLQNTYVKGKHYISTFTQVLQATSTDYLAKLNQRTNRTFEWVSPPTIVNAYYSPTANSITFPAGILQPPFYQHNSLHSLNYGAIGYVIGHEITHGYDDQGSEYNGVGKLESWWSKDTRDKYNDKKQCIIDQYTAQEVSIGNETVNLKGNQTIGENIADNGGIRETFQAYLLTNEGDVRLPGLEDLEPKKLFFLSAANIWCTKFTPESLKDQIDNGVHSPGQFRAEIPLANTEEFAQVFQCSKGSRMNPNTKCVLW